MTDYSAILDMSDEDLDDYLSVALSSKTVTPAERKKLQPLVRFYAKKAHPFRACVRDNRKRFGPLTEKYCAVIKDLIEGTTAWRGKKTGMSETTTKELFALSIDDSFGHFIAELSDEEIAELITESEETDKEEIEFADNPEQFLAEMYFANESVEQTPDDDGLIWKPILRTGQWKYSPGAGLSQPKPITVVKSGKSSKEDLVISLAELKTNFEKGAIEHVTIPSSHADKVLENTGFIKKLRFAKDEEGRDVLEAAHDFTEPDIKEKAVRGTIANTSAGILFDYIHKETGKKYSSVLAHVALTNRPWLNGMKPFGVNASENLEVVGFSDEPINDDPATTGGGDINMPEPINFEELGFSSKEELQAALEEHRTLKAKDRERDVADRCKTWQEEGKSPALVAEARQIMMSDEGATAVNLSEDGRTVGLSASDIVERLMSKTTGVKLDQDPVNDKTVSDDKPVDSDQVVELSRSEKALATQLFFDEGLSMEEAVKEAKSRLKSGQTG